MGLRIDLVNGEPLEIPPEVVAQKGEAIDAYWRAEHARRGLHQALEENDRRGKLYASLLAEGKSEADAKAAIAALGPLPPATPPSPAGDPPPETPTRARARRDQEG